MHGRPRKPPSAAESAASAAKAAKLRDLQAQLLHHHRNKLYTREALAASEKLLEMNPEVYTAWNYRKMAFEYHLSYESEPEPIDSLVNDELRTVEMALRRNPKCYGAWHHRKWVLSQGLMDVDFDREFRLLNQLLKADSRNFHGWNYRRFVAKLKNVAEVDELKFTMDMINTNFSNYSAWHNRSVLLSNLLKQKAEGFDTKESIITEEYDLVRQALFTDPSDQSGWFFHRWLLDQTVTTDDPLLIATWPFHGSDWNLSTDGNLRCWKLIPSSCPNIHYSLQMGILPIILYFNQAVRGVNSSTVTVSSMFAKNEDLIWRPLSSTKSGGAQCWMMRLNISDAKTSISEACIFEVTVGSSPDIISLSGSPYNQPLKLVFSLNTKSLHSEQPGCESGEELFHWNTNQELDGESVPEIYFDKLNNTNAHVPEIFKWNVDTLNNEILLFKELSEENCKFVKLKLAQLLVAQDALMSHGTLFMQKSSHSEEVLDLFNNLVKSDPSHARYYMDERSLVLMNQATFDKESMMKHCGHTCKSTSSGPYQHACLRLNRLSLTRIGFVEHLLWVQRLDLSYNELRSIEGLEALQLLVYLNLSNNHISSFTALDPLKLLNSLRVLNISFNEIGAHPVDTTRYLCLSPLWQTRDASEILQVSKKDNIEPAHNWEAVLLFKGLNLTQLDVSGNAVVNDCFRGVLRKLLPTLKWLDGQPV
ncbi:geranylgeranyl transferase type-2 subunit alpha 1 [Iris pallida]|uniref:Geranylgeranyl transferase type-2 subunit alpha n=1 Tax=Iris pallida TaxID=29817 RepID=A0AAX6ETM0_IRIPA|nr:geranylgeranyl transferase type-2 subunit alpha 1 [Iris pallida]